MKLSTELRNLPIVSIAEGEEVGAVKDCIIDPALKAIVAIVIEDPLWYEGAKIISFSLIHSIGDFAITTENASSVVSLTSMPELAELIKKQIHIVGAKIITRGGRLVGFVKEYSLDDRTGEILGLELSNDSDIASPDRNIIPCSSVVTIGRDVIIVNEDIETALCSSHAEVAGDMTSAPRPAPRPMPAAPRPAPAPAPMPVAPPMPEPEPEPVFVPEPAVEYAPPAPKEPAHKAGIDAELEVDIEELLDLDNETGLVQEEAVADAAAQAADAGGIPLIEEDGAKESLSEIFERRQIKYMIGKKVSRDIDADDGSSVIRQGETITDSVIKKAKEYGKFLELSMNIEIED
jgi:uncharacterized protein YrrD